jgi:hypothetical protein
MTITALRILFRCLWSLTLQSISVEVNLHWPQCAWQKQANNDTCQWPLLTCRLLQVHILWKSCSCSVTCSTGKLPVIAPVQSSNDVGEASTPICTERLQQRLTTQIMHAHDIKYAVMQQGVSYTAWQCSVTCSASPFTRSACLGCAMHLDRVQDSAAGNSMDTAHGYASNMSTCEEHGPHSSKGAEQKATNVSSCNCQLSRLVSKDYRVHHQASYHDHCRAKHCHQM